MEFSVIFWNIWQTNQLNDRRLRLLCDQLADIVARHKPDALGLNEVLAEPGSKRSRVLDFLDMQGYQTHFAPFGPRKQDYLTGSALATRQTPLALRLHELGPDNTAAWHGHKGHTVKLILAELPIKNGGILRMGVNHFAHLVPYNWSTHRQHHRGLCNITAQPTLQQRTIIGGDFNQLKFMPRLGELTKRYHRATGTFRNPTWRPGGAPLALLRANYDNIFWSKCGQLELLEFAVLPRRPSDHAPLWARFRIT